MEDGGIPEESRTVAFSKAPSRRSILSHFTDNLDTSLTSAAKRKLVPENAGMN